VKHDGALPALLVVAVELVEIGDYRLSWPGE
jgi:hypothetical protein